MPHPVLIYFALLWIVCCRKRFEPTADGDYKAFLIAGIVLSRGFGLVPWLGLRR